MFVSAPHPVCLECDKRVDIRNNNLMFGSDAEKNMDHLFHTLHFERDFSVGGEDTCWSVLTLDPPEVVGELGDNFLVNCTSFEEEFDEIFWTYGSTESEREDVKSFTLLSMSLSEWDVAVKCTVKLNSSFECSTDLKITVYSKCHCKPVHHQ